MHRYRLPGPVGIRHRPGPLLFAHFPLPRVLASGALVGHAPLPVPLALPELAIVNLSSKTNRMGFVPLLPGRVSVSTAFPLEIPLQVGRRRLASRYIVKGMDTGVLEDGSGAVQKYSIILCGWCLRRFLNRTLIQQSARSETRSISIKSREFRLFLAISRSPLASVMRSTPSPVNSVIL